MQLQEQLFKLYHNERDIERLSEELRGKQRDLDRMVGGNNAYMYIEQHDLHMYKE